MTDEAGQDATYHVVLIGIDAYEMVGQLQGCVSDIDSVQRLLITRAGIPVTQITRLASPHPTPERDSTVPTQPATLANIRSALRELGSEMVGPLDRVLVYYAGHGARPEVRLAGSSGSPSETSRLHEALVPADGAMDGTNVLFDVEFNELLAGIAGRTQRVTVVLDCCHAGGATRSLDGAADNTRFVDIGPVERSSDEQHPSGSGIDVAPGMRSPSVDACQVIAACQSHELAHEVPKVVAEGETRSGLLTRSLITALDQVADDELRTVPWALLWNQLRAAVETEPEAHGRQHPWMSGGLARAWLGGEPDDGDVGLGVELVDGRPEHYRIRAGTIAGITLGTRLAVYGAAPYQFPRLGIAEDLAARCPGGLLEVIEAAPGHAIASTSGEPFELPPGARGRVVQAGEEQRLQCAVVPEEPAVVEALAASPLLELSTDALALARLERRDGGDWVLTDDVHGVGPDDPVLVRLSADDVVNLGRGVMEHYVRYSGPLQMARRCPDLPGALRVSLLSCPTTSVAQVEVAGLDALPIGTTGAYALRERDMFCINVRNTSDKALKVSLFHADSSGQVAMLGEQVLDGGSSEYFWLGSQIGTPFQAVIQPGVGQCIDRMVAIGTTDMASDLKHLEESQTFVSGATRGIGSPAPVPAEPPADQWTATEVILRTSAGAA